MRNEILRNPRVFSSYAKKIHPYTSKAVNSNVYSLCWNKYDIGVGGNKPAMEFTPVVECGKVNKSKYCRRKKFWVVMERIIVEENYVCTIIQRIYAARVYRYKKVSCIIRALAGHKVSGAHGLLLHNT